MNPWISHVKTYALEHNLSYKDAMIQAKTTYKKIGGSRKSGFIKQMIKNKTLDISKVKKPSKNLKKIAGEMMPKKIKIKVIKKIKLHEQTEYPPIIPTLIKSKPSIKDELKFTDFKNKQLLIDAIDIYFRIRGKQISNLSKQNMEGLKNIIIKRNIPLSDLARIFNERVTLNMTNINVKKLPKLYIQPDKYKPYTQPEIEEIEEYEKTQGNLHFLNKDKEDKEYDDFKKQLSEDFAKLKKK